MHYDTPDFARRYALGRRMSTQSMELWIDAVAAHVKVCPLRIIDVGCGTGRFTSALAERFQASVLGLDPSLAMLNEAQKHRHGSGVWFVCASAERLPVGDAEIDLAFLSMVFHHFRDSRRACRELKRVTRGSGHVCVRNSTLDLLDSVPYLAFFPRAVAHNRARLPSPSAVIDAFERVGFRLLKHEVILQQFANSSQEYREKISKRALSDLALLSDSDFAAGSRHASWTRARAD